LKGETHILPSYTYPLVDIRALVQYRDLLWLLVRKEYVTQFRQTWLGPAWILLQPLSMSLILYVVFRHALRFSGAPTSFLFYFSGIIVWNFFSQVVESISFCLIQNARMFDKVYFPRLILPLSLLTWRLISFGIHFTVLLLWGIFTDHFPNVAIAFLPLVVALLAMLGLGVGLFVAAVSVRYRDLQQVVRLALQLLFFATPLVYAPEGIREDWRFLLGLNPLSAPLQIFRAGLGETAMPSLVSVGASMGISALVFVGGLWAFRWIERRFVDTI